MYVIGLTGGIACGKSEVSRRLAERGLPIVDADVVARQVVEPGQPVLAEIVEAFGDGILRDDGALDRKKLGRLVFADKALLDTLNSIIHPAIWRECLGQLALLRREHEVAVLVAPLLYEHGGDAWVDAVWAVGCSEEVQLQRLMERDGLDFEQARARLAAQMPLEQKLERADYAIMNEGSLEDLEAEITLVLEILSQILSNNIE